MTERTEFEQALTFHLIGDAHSLLIDSSLAV
jgi:hypothetical protein